MYYLGKTDRSGTLIQPEDEDNTIVESNNYYSTGILYVNKQNILSQQYTTVLRQILCVTNLDPAWCRNRKLSRRIKHKCIFNKCALLFPSVQRFFCGKEAIKKLN